MASLFSLQLALLVIAISMVNLGAAQCALAKNKNNLLGYEASSGDKVYEKVCSGSCSGNTICKASAFKKKTVTSQKGGGTTSQVTLVSACACTTTSGSGSCNYNGQTYANGATVYNTCGDKCVCSNGQVTNCCRQRKSFTAMSSAERQRFTQGIYDLSKGTGKATASMRSQYIGFVEDHRRNFNSGIHGMDQLLAWHRWYILQMENLLRQMDCRISLPFWKWEADYSNPWGSSVWRASDGVGGGSNNDCVSDGPFRPPFYLAPSAGSNACLRRERKGGVPSTSQVANLLNTPASSFSSFFNLISSMHAGVHCNVGGTMCIDHSANAPEFLLHHGNMDRIWATWQAKGSAYQQSYSSGVNNYMTSSPFTSNIRPRDVLDISNHLGVCVQYVDSSANLLAQTLMEVPSEILKTVPQTRPQWLKSARKFWRAMNMTKEEVNAMLQTIDESLNVAPSLPTSSIQNDTFALQFGISRAGLQDALNGWESVANSTEQAQIHKTKQLLNQIDNDIALKAFSDSQNGSSSSSSTTETASTEENVDDDDGGQQEVEVQIEP